VTVGLACTTWGEESAAAATAASVRYQRPQGALAGLWPLTLLVQGQLSLCAKPRDFRLGLPVGGLRSPMIAWFTTD
jgi:hypothetical protein